MAAFFRKVREVDPELSEFGLCVDTAHLWSCGVDIASREAAQTWLEELEAVSDVIPPGAVMFHLNDSLDDRGSGVDHHAPLLQGKIWGEYAEEPKESGLAAFVEYAVRHDTVAILERKPPSKLLDDYANLEKIDGSLAIAE